MRRRPNGTGTLRARNGRWQSIGTDPRTGKQRSKTWDSGVTRQEAERLHAEWHSLVLHGEILGRSPTLAEWLNTWLDGRGVEITDSTRTAYVYGVRHATELMGRARIDDIRPADIAWLLERVRKTRGQASVTRTRAVLSGAFRQAAEWGMVRSNPVAPVKPAKRRAAKDRSVPTTGQVQAIIAAADEPARFTFLTLLAGSGARCGELLALRWENVDLPAMSIRVAETVSVVAATGRRGAVADTKTHNPRTVQLTGETVDALASWRAALAAAVGLGAVRGQQFVFPSPRKPGQPCSHQWLYRTWHTALERAGIGEPITPHAVRHWYASTLMAANVPAQAIAEQLGNSIKEVQGRYGKHTPKDAARQAIAHLPALRG